jgi:steroid delta-isomerase-like uncharacterized protein
MRRSRKESRTAALRAIVVVVSLAALSCQPEAGNRVTAEQAQSIASQYMEARNTPDLDLLDRIYSADVIVHDSSAPEDIVGVAALKAYYADSHVGFPDFTIRIDETVTAQDRVVYWWTIDATHTGDLRGMPPTGRSVSFSGVAIDRIENGLIVEEWVYFNVLDLMLQLGMQVVPGEGLG